MTMSVETYAGDAAAWDEAARGCAGYTHFHRLGWLDVMAKVHGHRTVPLVARGASGTIEGVLPLVHVKSPLFGHYLVSMPFVNYGGPLGADAAVAALSARAVELARESGARLLELRSIRELPVDLAVSHRKITVVLEVPPREPDRLFKAFDGNVRRQVRRAQKANVTTRFGADQLDGFYGVFAHHMRDLGTPVQPRRFFDAIVREFGDSVWVGCAYHEGRPVAGGFGLQWGTEFEMTWVSALRAYHSVAANMGLYWAFIERCANEGLTRFNFGRCSPGGATHRFKSQWGAKDEPLFWYQWGEGVAGTPSPSDAKYALGPKIWSRLPVSLATLLGPPIVRGIP